MMGYQYVKFANGKSPIMFPCPGPLVHKYLCLTSLHSAKVTIFDWEEESLNWCYIFRPHLAVMG